MSVVHVVEHCGMNGGEDGVEEHAAGQDEEDIIEDVLLLQC